MTTLNGDTTTLPLTTATILIEEGLIRDEQINEVYLPLTSTVVQKRKQEMLYVPLDFVNNLTVDGRLRSFFQSNRPGRLGHNKTESLE